MLAVAALEGIVGEGIRVDTAGFVGFLSLASAHSSVHLHQNAHCRLGLRSQNQLD